MKNLLLVLAGLFCLAGPAAAQPGAADYSPADYRRLNLANSEHARLVRALLRYELGHLRSFLRCEALVQRRSFTYTIQNRAALAEVIGGEYVVSFYDAAGTELARVPGHFGHVPPSDSQNMEVRFAPPAGAVTARMRLTSVKAE